MAAEPAVGHTSADTATTEQRDPLRHPQAVGCTLSNGAKLSPGNF